MKLKNCWEVMNCERYPGSANVEKLGLCPAAAPNEYDGINRGKQGGRFCWAMAGTLCGSKIQGTYADKLMDCLNCNFLKLVNQEEDRHFILSPVDAKYKSKNKV